MTIDLERMKTHMPHEDYDYTGTGELFAINCIADDCNFEVRIPEPKPEDYQSPSAMREDRERAELKARRMFVDHQTGERYASPCRWIISGRPDHPDGETWGDDKLKCHKANGHDGDHETADGYTFSARRHLIGFTNGERDAGRKAGDTDPCRMPGCLKTKGHLGDHFYIRFS